MYKCKKKKEKKKDEVITRKYLDEILYSNMIFDKYGGAVP